MAHNIYVVIVIILSLVSAILSFLMGLDVFNNGLTWMALAIWSMSVTLVVIAYHYYKYEWDYYKKY